MNPWRGFGGGGGGGGVRVAGGARPPPRPRPETRGPRPPSAWPAPGGRADLRPGALVQVVVVAPAEVPVPVDTERVVRPQALLNPADHRAGGLVDLLPRPRGLRVLPDRDVEAPAARVQLVDAERIGDVVDDRIGGEIPLDEAAVPARAAVAADGEVEVGAGEGRAPDPAGERQAAPAADRRPRALLVGGEGAVVVGDIQNGTTRPGGRRAGIARRRRDDEERHGANRRDQRLHDARPA